MDYAGIIDHTLLKPDATQADIKLLCRQARQYQFASVCVSPLWVQYAGEQLAGSGAAVCTVVGFPLGASPPAVKVFEARRAIADGATELDMVIPIGLLKSGDYDRVLFDIAEVVNAAKGRALTKVILETCLLTDEEKTTACKLAVQAGADFVKTSTGFAGGGATVHDVALLRQTVGAVVGVKAAGGIRDKAAVAAMVAAGATRIGTSNGVKIVMET